MAVFSVIKYEPKKEEEIRRRQKLEALGGGGSQFVMPSRDWRGVSYRGLLPRIEKKNKTFNRIIEQGKREAFKRRRLRLKKIRKRERRNRKRRQEKNARVGDNVDMSPSDDESDSNTVVSCDDVPFFESDAFVGSDIIGSDRVDEDIKIDYSSSSSEESTAYYPGFLDDPEMTKGTPLTR